MVMFASFKRVQRAKIDPAATKRRNFRKGLPIVGAVTVKYDW